MSQVVLLRLFVLNSVADLLSRGCLGEKLVAKSPLQFVIGLLLLNWLWALQFVETCSSLRAIGGMEVNQEAGERYSSVPVLPGPLPASSQETSVPILKSHWWLWAELIISKVDNCSVESVSINYSDCFYSEQREAEWIVLGCNSSCPKVDI